MNEKLHNLLLKIAIMCVNCMVLSAVLALLWQPAFYAAFGFGAIVGICALIALNIDTWNCK